MQGLSIHAPIMPLKAKCEEGLRSLWDPGQVLFLQVLPLAPQWQEEGSVWEEAGERPETN